MKLALGICLLSGASLVVLYGILVGVMVPKWQASVGQLWNVAAVQTRDGMMEVVNATLQFIQFTARAVPRFDHRSSSTANASAAMPYDPSMLLQSFAALNELSGYRLGSMGFLMRAAPAPSRPPNAKVSWQVANGFGCPTYMYAFSDNTINPQFLGYCGLASGTVNQTVPAYVGTDWGLKPLEVALLDGTLGTTGTFLPIFDLLGSFTLTYESAYKDALTGQSAVSFGEVDLTRLSDHITSQVSLLNGRGIAFIYETASGAMIASTVNGTIFDANHTRYTIFNVTNQSMQDTADGQDNAWLITLTRRTEPGLNWTVVVAARDSDIKGNINDAIVIASVAGLCVLLALVLITWIGIHCCVTRQLRAKREGSVSIPYTIFDDIK